jgi:hypothetical protein
MAVISERQETVKPVPPPQLWGLWVQKRGGYWLNHTNGPDPGQPNPMTWTSREDAEAAAEYERQDFGEITVALVGVAPATARPIDWIKLQARATLGAAHEARESREEFRRGWPFPSDPEENEESRLHMIDFLSENIVRCREDFDSLLAQIEPTDPAFVAKLRERWTRQVG